MRCVDCGYESDNNRHFLGTAKVLEDIWRCRPCGGFKLECFDGMYPRSTPVLDPDGKPSVTVQSPTKPAEQPEEWVEA
jgi:hypothetical protein